MESVVTQGQQVGDLRLGGFKAIDFFKTETQIVEGAQDIIATSVVSVKTTTTKDVFAWLRQTEVDNNITNLKGGKVFWVKKTILFGDITPEIHICMPKEIITQALKDTWIIELNKKQGIKFEIFAIEDYMKL